MGLFWTQLLAKPLLVKKCELLQCFFGNHFQRRLEISVLPYIRQYVLWIRRGKSTNTGILLLLFILVLYFNRYE